MVANLVDHPGIVSVLDDDVTDDGAPLLVMDLLDGEIVDTRLERSPGGGMDPRAVCRIGLALLDVLAAAHDKGTVHRDVKARQPLPDDRRPVQAPRLRHSRG